MLSLFLKGWMIGFLIVMPFGPIGVLCLQHSLRGTCVGLAAGLGVTCADLIYATLASLGVSAVYEFLHHYLFWLQIFGAVCLWYLGISSIFFPKKNRSFAPPAANSIKIFLSTFTITATNPLTFLTFAALFTGFGVVLSQNESLSATMLAIGVLLGSSTWWVLLNMAISSMGKKMEPYFSLFHRISGAVILIFALVLSIEVIHDIL